MNNLTGNKPDRAEDDVKHMIEQRRNIHLGKMNERSGETLMLDDDDFETVLTKFKSKQTKTYDFLIKA